MFNFIEAAIEKCSTKWCSAKTVLRKVFCNRVFLQWSKFSSKAFISIADLNKTTLDRAEKLIS